jgi:hypothetical protein
MALGKGLRPTPAHQVGLGHAIHLRAAPPPPQSARVLMPAAVDQGAASSCTGNASAVAICAEMAHGGAFPELPSRLFLYFHARAAIGEQGRDEGATIGDIFEQAAKLGVPPEKAWAYSDAFDKVTSQPDWEAYREGADQRIVSGAYRLSSFGDELVDDVKRAIAAGSVVVWGTQVDQAFEDLSPGRVWPGVGGSSLGGHAMVLFMYDGDIFWTRSSWGSGWCEGGSARVSADAVKAGLEFWIVAPTVPVWSGTI